MTNWYLENGKESDVVVSSRVRLARNIREYPFESKCTKKELQEILNKVKDIVPSIGYGLKFLKLRDMDEVTKMSLLEKRVLSPEILLNKNEYGAILINREENICVLLNEEDHIRIQVFSSGLELENSLNFIVEIDEKIGNILDYSYSEKYGFLTTCPTNVGTGLKASVMVHLPALTKTGNINKILQIINNFGMNIRGIYGEGTEAKGDLYQISNKQTLGITEKEIIKNLQVITEKVIEQERLARKYLGKDKIKLEDSVYRKYGILSNCKKISAEECKELLSSVKLGVDLGIIKELNDAKIQKLLLYTKSANLQKYLGKILDEYEIDIKRAEIIKQIISEE